MKPTESLNLGRGFCVKKNRTLLAAMTNKQSHEDGTLSSEEIDWLTRRAKGDFAITTTAAANVTEFGRGWEGEMGVWGDHQLPGLTKMATQLNSAGTVSLVQLFHGGMRAPRAINGVRPVSASENTESGMNGEFTHAMSSEEVSEMIQFFTKAADKWGGDIARSRLVSCEQAGFHGVELHGAHSYLICQFLGKKTNRRTDKWGGDIAGRSRFFVRIN